MLTKYSDELFIFSHSIIFFTSHCNTIWKLGSKSIKSIQISMKTSKETKDGKLYGPPKLTIAAKYLSVFFYWSWFLHPFQLSITSAERVMLDLGIFILKKKLLAMSNENFSLRCNFLIAYNFQCEMPQNTTILFIFVRNISCYTLFLFLEMEIWKWKQNQIPETVMQVYDYNYLVTTSKFGCFFTINLPSQYRFIGMLTLRYSFNPQNPFVTSDD